MTFNDKDIRPNTPRPLSQCGTYVAPGRDARWSYGQENILADTPAD